MHYIFQEGLENLVEPSTKAVERTPISDEWRGWNYHNENLRPPVDNVVLPIYAVAGNYCKSGRDIYLKFVKKLKSQPNGAMIVGSMYHSILATLMEKSREYIYSRDLDEKFDISKFLFFEGKKVIDEQINGNDATRGLKDGIISKKELDDARENLEKLWKYESLLVTASVNFHLAKHLHMNKDTLARHGIPVFTEQKLDGRKLSLSSNLSVDALHLPGKTVVIDIKTGMKNDFHRLTTTGYAMVIESVERKPVDVGCIIYPSFTKKRSVPTFEVDVHPITDKLRKEFIENRNRKLEIVANGTDPLHEDGSEWCKSCEIFKKE